MDLAKTLHISAAGMKAQGVRLRVLSENVANADSVARTPDGERGSVAWDFMSAVTPSAVGGAPLAAYFVAKDNRIPVGEATAIMLFSMLLDQLWFAITIPVLLGASLVMDVFPQTLGRVGVGAALLYFVGMLAWVLAFAYTMLVRPDFLERLVNWLFSLRWLRRFQDRAAHEAQQLRSRAHILRDQPPHFYLMGLLLTAGTWMARYLTLVFIVWSVYAAADGLLLVLRTAAMLLGSLVMPTPGGSGGIEGLYAFFVAPLMPSAVVAPTLLVWRLLAYYLFIALGVYLTMHHVRRRRTVAEPSAARRDHTTGVVAPPPAEVPAEDVEAR